MGLSQVMSEKQVKSDNLVQETPYSFLNDIKEEHKDIAYSLSEDNVKRLAGKVLTLIDASIAEDKQNKAMKDLVKQYFRETIEQFQSFWFYQDGNGPTKGHSVNLDNLENR